MCLDGLASARTIDDAIFNSKTNRIPSNVANAALAAGLPSGSLEPFVELIVSRHRAAAAAIAVANEMIITAVEGAVIDTYVASFRYVWLSAIPFLAVAAIGRTSFLSTFCMGVRL